MGEVAAAGPPEMVQATVTAPVKPPAGVTETGDVPEVAGEVMVMGVPESEKDGAAVGPETVTARFTDLEIAPEEADDDADTAAM